MAHTRMDLLASEFQRAGIAADAAVVLSCDAVIRHPLAHRMGVPNLAQRMVAHGAEPEPATQLALAMWGLECLGLGACYQDLLDTLRRAGVDDHAAVPACVTARRLWREATERDPEPDLDLQLARWCVVFLASMALASALLQLAG